MTCDIFTGQIQPLLDQNHRDPLAKSEQLTQHIETCQSCQRQLAEHQQYLQLMKSFRAPQSDAHRAHLLNTAVECGRKRENQQHKKMAFVQGFIAASIVAFAVVIGMQATQPSAFDKTQITAALQKGSFSDHQVTFLIYAEQDMANATLTFHLPEDFSIAGQEHLSTLEWSVNLHRGSNSLILPVELATYAEFIDSSSLVAQITYKNNKKQFRLSLDLTSSQAPKHGQDTSVPVLKQHV